MGGKNLPPVTISSLPPSSNAGIPPTSIQLLKIPTSSSFLDPALTSASLSDSSACEMDQEERKKE